MNLIYYKICFVVILLFPSIIKADNKKEYVNVLYINSYNLGYPWTDSVTEGFRESLDTTTHINYFCEFMDTKRFSRHHTFSNFYAYIRNKYKNTSFDIVVAADNNAVDFYFNHKDSSIFINKPFVFCGIPNIEDYDFSNIDAYGIVEGLALTHIFFSMQRLFPQREVVHAIINDTYSDSIYVDIIKEYIQNFNEPKFNIVRAYDKDSIVDYLSTLGDNDMVYLFNNLYRTESYSKPYVNILNTLKPRLHIPVFSNTQTGIDHLVGGEENMGIKTGILLAKIVIQIADKKEITERILYPKGNLIYNYNELKRFKVDFSLLPRDAVIVNKPETIFDKFKNLIIVNFFFIAACVAIIIILIINNKKQKEYRLKIETARDKAMQSESVKISFIANVSHEIRTPLNAIIGFSDILMAENKDTELDEFVKHIHESSQILERLVNDVLDLSLIDSNEVKLNNSEISLHEFADELVKRNALQIDQYEKPKLKLRLKEPEDGPKIIYTDKYRLNQVLQNLINNAIKYSISGTITLSYKHLNRKDIESMSQLDKFELNYDRYLLFSVRDHGIGIPQELKNFVFERFRRIDQLYIGHHGGVGLGLNISQSLIKIMGGEIWFTSVQGKGSTFSFIIPDIQHNGINEE